MKKLVSKLMAATIISSMVLTGCGGNAKPATGTPAEDKGTTTAGKPVEFDVLQFKL